MALNGIIFEPVPEEVLETIADHDAGWAETDLTALEQVESRPPTSFVSLTAESAVRIWRRSIERAAKRSRLSEYLVRSHFYLLAPRDGQREHQLFREEQEERLRVAGIGASYDPPDLARFVSYLGFCELLSLHLCSGWNTK